MSSAGDDGNPKRGMGISKDEIAARKAQQVCVCVCGVARKGTLQARARMRQVLSLL